MSKTPRVQRHHITYDPEIIVPLYQGEHYIITQIQRRKNISHGFLESLEFEIIRMRRLAVELPMPEGRMRRRKCKRH